MNDEMKQKLKEIAPNLLEEKDLPNYLLLQEIADSLEKMANKPEMEMPDMPKIEIPSVQTVRIEGVEMLKGEKGDSVKGDSYILTEKDKKEIASKITVPVVVKEIETIIEKQPIITNEIKEVAVADTSKQVKEKLLEAGLEIQNVKELETEIKRLDKKIDDKPTGRMGGMKKFQYTKRIRLTDQCNGVTKSFTLPKDTVDVLGVFGTQFPVNYDPFNSSGGDWSLTGNTLTLGSGVGAPETGQTLWALIETLFY